MMGESAGRSSRGRFSISSIRALKVAVADDAYNELQPATDLQMLVSFLERFDALGWIPPLTMEKQILLAAHDVTMHQVRQDLLFYEFCSKGGRGERDPWISIFFHVASDRQVRICGVELTAFVERQ